MRNRLRHLAAAVALTLALATPLAACSSSDSSDLASAASTTTTEQTTTTTAAAGDLGAFCDSFADLVAGRDPDDPSQLDFGDGSPEDVAAAYAAQLATVEDMAASAPADMADNAETYAEMIQVRAAAAAETGATSIQDMDPSTRADFLASESANQAQINELLGYARDTCGT